MMHHRSFLLCCSPSSWGEVIWSPSFPSDSHFRPPLSRPTTPTITTSPTPTSFSYPNYSIRFMLLVLLFLFLYDILLPQAAPTSIYTCRPPRSNQQYRLSTYCWRRSCSFLRFLPAPLRMPTGVDTSRNDPATSSSSSERNSIAETESRTVIDAAESTARQPNESPPNQSRWSLGILNVPDVTDVPG